MLGIETILEMIEQLLSKTLPDEREALFSTLLTELLSAGGLPMDGGTTQSLLPDSPAKVNDIAALLNKKATTTRNKYTVYPFARASLSASGPCYYICAHTGELMLLLNRSLKNSEQWFYAAGYMEVLPANTEKIFAERVSEEMRNKAEEETVGIYLPTPENQGTQPADDAQYIMLPRPIPLKQLIHDEFKRLSSVERWDIVINRLSDADYLRNLFERHGIIWPPHIDISSKCTYIRETHEETGLDLAAYPDAVIKFVRSIDISILGGITRLYNVDQLYFGYLGILDQAPVLAASTLESVETAWVAVRDIYRDPKRNQYVVSHDDRPLHFTAMRGIEYTLLGLLEYFIEKVSQVQKPHSAESVPLLSNVAGVQASLIPHNKANSIAIAELIGFKLGPEKTLPSMIHAGQAIFRSFVAAAKGITQGATAKELEAMIVSAQAQPLDLVKLVK